MLPYAVGPTYSATVAITRPSNTTAYVANDVIGAADTTTAANAGSAIITIPEVGAAGSTVLIQTVELFIGNTAVPAGMGAFRLHFYKLPPAAILDNAAFDLASTETGRYIGFASLAAPTDLGSTLFTVANDVNLLADLVPYSSRLYAELETIGGYTPASGTVYTINVSTIQVTQFRTGQENLLWSLAGGVAPSLDLEFARTKTLNNEVTGTPPVTFTRASTATYVGSDGVLKTAAVNEPRFDHNPTTGESLGLLVEEQRTNLLRYSEDISQWLAPTNITLSQNQTTAPDGTTTADQYLETATAGLHSQDGMDFLFVTSITYVYSVFVKSINGRNYEIGFPPTVFTNRFARFTLSGAGTVQGTDAGVTAGIQAYPNGWYRCWATNTCASGGNARIGNFINDATNSRSYAGNTANGLFIWGAQLEAGAMPTSYIPTTTATVTRSADVASITGTAFSSFYRQDEGTLYGDARKEYAVTAFPVIADGRVSSTDIVQIGYITESQSVGYVKAGNSDQAAIYNGSLSGVRSRRIALGMKVNDFSVSTNGGALVSDTAGSMPSNIASLFLGGTSAGAASNCLNGTIRRLTYWPQRLPNNALQTITQ